MTKAVKPRAKKAPAPQTEAVTAYKAFNKDFTCRDFQYEVGATYEHTGSVAACSSGFHACEFPLDIFDYYSVCDSRFAVVELSGELSRHDSDSKIAAGKITIRAEIGIPQLVADAIKWVMAYAKGAENIEAASGDYSKQAASGHSSKQAASGDYSKQAASGDYSKQAASGDYSKQAASGDYSKQAASGDYSKQAASGHSSKQAASGDSSKQAASGQKSVAMAAGAGGNVKAGRDGCFALRWDDSKRPRIVVGYVGENGIKADTWYTVNDNGLIVECVE